MSKRILILAGSPRKNGNSAALCRDFARGAEDSGHQVETIFLRDKKIGFCLACYHCKKSGGICIIKDDMADILDKMNAADVLVMASPVYFYSVYAQMKALIDRTVEAAAKCGAAAPAVPVKDTIKTVAEDGAVTGTPDRSTLRAVQTPQVFEADLLKASLQSALENEVPVTDDCSAVERLGKVVYLIDGDEENLKITTPVDLVIAEAILAEREGR